MNYPTFRFVFDRKNTATKEHRALVQLEVYLNPKRKYISTGVKLYKGQWHPQKKAVNTIDAGAINERLDSIMCKLQSWISELIKNNEPFTFAKLDAFLGKDEYERNNIIKYIEYTLNKRNDIRKITKKSHRKLVGALTDFGGIVHFNDLTKKNILAYDDWLHGKGYLQTTVHSYHTYLKTYINIAIREGLLKENPYNGVSIKRGKSEIRKYLTGEELEKVESAVIDTPTIERVRDVFVFQCYTGLAYADLSKFDFSKVVRRNDGKYVLSDVRQKTSEQYYIVLLSPALRILEKYDFKLPIITNQQYNLRLKIVADYARLGRKLTTHMARHTFASLCLNNGAKIENVAKMLGHSNIATTQLYARIFNSEVEKEFDMLESIIKSKQTVV